MTNPNEQGQQKSWLRRHVGDILPALAFAVIIAAALLMRMCNSH
ncbi:MAG: hypothetical protein PHU25_18790 [Deltaproteobacteria bacterium]|nr:hypothetical protein [Deltaproteobacteria bacterium]